MYFRSRVEAGKQLATKLTYLKGEDCAIVALSDGAVVVAAQVAAVLRCVMMMLMAEPIKAPGEPDAVASIDQDGGYTYNSQYSQGQIEEFDMEYHQSFEQQKLERLSGMHRLIGLRGLIRRDLLHGRIVIVVSDGLGSAYSLDAAQAYLKTTKVKRLIIATPIASIGAVDRMHILADEICCLGVTENFMGSNHYYEDNRLPPHDTVIDTIQNVVDQWQLPAQLAPARH
jgi:putative phosphoribosyl transferase